MATAEVRWAMVDACPLAGQVKHKHVHCRCPLCLAQGGRFDFCVVSGEYVAGAPA